MTTKLKVYANTGPSGMRSVVAVESVPAAAKLLRISQYELRNYWSITSNEADVAQALSEPGTVFIKWDHPLGGGWRKRSEK